MTLQVSTGHGQDELALLTETVRLAADNVARGGGPFGALVARNGEVLAVGSNQVTPTLDPTAHAEVVAIRGACRRLGDFRLTGCVLVTSCEPCPLCLSAALWARVDRVLYAADRHDAAAAGFDDLAFHRLFETPRETWSVRVEQIDHAERTAPFAAWLARPDRTKY
ncbi:nucleoside deaminase [Streptoalloteichus hindustanus]|uniref:tRNA(Arg) A34 adenosine deaminase TadA n=1 Tax=Streptoalloteichus hindustanus TaxID=2017 RepID=A0A1M5Q1D5_STRHI|nr:nucleoside deaminase [Streptoalloteichus hindustanus]SHH07732.1 tRNA(Arg) A34 adenosine deaminase TadA [Streptoalloteichus hindustanus]